VKGLIELIDFDPAWVPPIQKALEAALRDERRALARRLKHLPAKPRKHLKLFFDGSD
jgi:hypothetical protein